VEIYTQIPPLSTEDNIMTNVKKIAFVVAMAFSLLLIGISCENRSKKKMLEDNVLNFVVTEGLMDSNILTVYHNMEKNWDVHVERDWIFVTPLAGEGRGTSEARFTLSIAADGSKLQNGTYNGNVQVTDGYNSKWWACKVTVNYDPLVLDAVVPSFGHMSGGTEVFLSGSGFREGTTARFGPQLNAVVDTTYYGPDMLSCITPPGPPGCVSVTVVVPNGRSYTLAEADAYYYTIIDIDSVTPASGEVVGGTVVDIYGKGFTPSTQVWFGTEPATNITYVMGSMIQATTPPSVTGAGPVSVFVMNPIKPVDTIELIDAFTYF
jgi:hypothetical protein